MKFITVTPSNHKNRHYVARQMIGGDYTIVATCSHEDVAKQICEAMNVIPEQVVKPARVRRVA